MTEIDVVYDYQVFSMQQYGGVSRYFCELAERIHGMSGWHARVVAPLHVNHHLRISGVPTWGRHVGPPRRGAERWRGVFNRATSAAWQFIARPRIVHWTYYLRQPRVPGIKYVVTVYDMIHELFPESFSADDQSSRLKRECVEAADHVICISHSTACDLMRLFNVAESKITVTHLGFSRAFSQAHRLAATPSTPGSRPYLLYVGHRHGYKNFSGLLAAYRASPRLRQGFDLVCFGGEPLDDSREPDVKRLTGSDDDLARAYAGAHAFVYPSLYEGFGIPPLEAMSCGCPVACSNTSSIPEVVGHAAELFDPHNLDSMRRALEHICFDEARRAELVTAGHLRAGQFSWDRCAAETAQSYRRLLA